MFAATYSSVVGLKSVVKTKTKFNTSTRAAHVWTLDGRGCAGARTGDTGKLKTNTVTTDKQLNNNIVAYKRAPAAESCPLKPISITELCDERDGKFRMLDAVFEQQGEDVYVYGLKYDGTQKVESVCTVDGWQLPTTSWSKIKLKPGQVVELNGEKFTVFRNVVCEA